MKKTNQKKRIFLPLFIALLVFAALSFAPCFECKTVSLFSDIHGEIPARTESYGYIPVLSCLVSGLELILLLFPPKTVLRIIGIALTAIKTLVPFPLFRILLLLFMNADGLTSTTLSKTPIVYGLQIIGAITALLYLWDIIRIRKRAGHDPSSIGSPSEL